MFLSAEPNTFFLFFLVHLAFVSWWKLYIFWIYWKEWVNIPLNLIEFILVAKWMVESNTSGKKYFWTILFLPVCRGYMGFSHDVVRYTAKTQFCIKMESNAFHEISQLLVCTITMIQYFVFNVSRRKHCLLFKWNMSLWRSFIVA